MKDELHDQPAVFIYENANTDEIRFELYPNNHLRMTMDFAKDMTLPDFLKFVDSCGYKLKKAPLRVVK